MTLIDVMVRKHGEVAVATARQEIGIGAVDSEWSERLPGLCSALVKEETGELVVATGKKDRCCSLSK